MADILMLLASGAEGHAAGADSSADGAGEGEVGGGGVEAVEDFLHIHFGNAAGRTLQAVVSKIKT